MKMYNKQLVAAMTMVLISTFSFAREWVGNGKSGNGNNGGDGTAANCSAPVGQDELSINNVRALIQTGGDMWWDLVGQPRYEVPKGSGHTALFAGSLWLGGRDASGQLKVAALRFRGNGTDFWTGPLNTVTAEIDPSTCNEWDTHFKTTRVEIEQFVNEAPGFQVTETIKNWPAHGDPANQEDWNLAPFIDVDGDGFYSWEAGDYPGYDLTGNVDCGGKLVNIYGDENLWWIFNDKGNIHTETGGQAIGMEIRAQAFSFATNDEVNNMTFYNYELVNRSTFELRDTYFGFWVDADLGNAQDDYVGCDVERGLGFTYNGDEFDEDNGGAKGYGFNPPAIGADFFQGPFQDADQKDNCLCDNYASAIADDGIVYSGSGVGYGDSIVDNERLGMRAFLYHINQASGPTADPQTANDYYNYLRSFWRDNSRMVYGGNGHQNSSLADPDVEADFMFPGDSDPLGWGTQGVPQRNWTEVTEGNIPQDRRFIQSAGPFKLAPGAVNNITVGMVWARATTGGANASVETLKQADTKTQALFDNCFQLLDGPDAPTVEVRELENELVLTLSSTLGNNKEESYNEIDPFIVAPDTFYAEDDVDQTDPITRRTYPLIYDSLSREYRSYKFQGYQVFQLKDASVSAADLYDQDKARLVFQCDLEDEVTRLINYRFDRDLNAIVPEERVGNAANSGIFKTFSLTEDAFALTDKRLVNYQTYYYMAIAYAHNNYKTYNQSDPFALDGQKEPYLPSRKSPIGPILRYSAIPRPGVKDGDPVKINAAYGDYIPVTRLEGMGNTGNYLAVQSGTFDQLISGEVNSVKNITYVADVNGDPATPITVKVVDPIEVKDGDYTLYFTDDEDGEIEKASWFIVGSNLTDTIYSKNTIDLQKEEVIPELGISITVKDVAAPGQDIITNGLVGSNIVYEDPSKAWLAGLPNRDGEDAFNWIRSGKNAIEDQEAFWDYEFTNSNNNDEKFGVDIDEHFEGVVGGTWAPYRLATWNLHGPAGVYEGHDKTDSEKNTAWVSMWRALPTSNLDVAYALNYLHSVDIVFTPDQSKWTRCVVLEMQEDPTLSEGNVHKLYPRAGASVDKAGLSAGMAGYNAEEGGLVADSGMGWFPGYAVDIETGERLNMAFGEDSYLQSENGNDMIWNPTSTVVEGIVGNTIRFGGKHYVYVFRNGDDEDQQHQNPRDYNVPENRMPSYDMGAYMYNKLKVVDKTTYEHVYRSTMWVGTTFLAPNEDLLSTTATVQIRVKKPYTRYANNQLFNVGDELTEGEEYLVRLGPISYNNETYFRGDVITGVAGEVIGDVAGNTGTLSDTLNNVSSTINGGRPTYGFGIEGFEPGPSSELGESEIMSRIQAVPNPYYAYSDYEADKNDYKMYITNLPRQARIKIFTLNGVLVREFVKDDESISFVEWDLKNFARIQVGSGMYLIHVEVPGVGEKVIKWFGVLRPVDLDSF